MKEEWSCRQFSFVAVCFLLFDIILVGSINYVFDGSSVPVDEVSLYSLAAILFGRFSFGIFSSAITNLRMVDLLKVYSLDLIISFIIISAYNGIEFQVVKHEVLIIFMSIVISVFVMSIGVYASRFVKMKSQSQWISQR